MSTLTQPSQDDLAVAVEHNLFAFLEAMGVIPHSETQDSAQMLRYHRKIISPMFNGVARVKLEPSDVDAAIDESITFFKERNQPYLFWWDTPSTTPKNLGDTLLANGFTAWETNAPGMTIELDKLEHDGTLPKGFSLETVKDEKSLLEWGHTFNRANETPEFAGMSWVEATRQIGIERAPWTLYLGRFEGQLVAVNILFCGVGVASVYGVAVIPEMRGRGFGKAVTAIPFLRARDMGYRYGVLFSTPEGHPVYQKLGFEDCDWNISRYLWRVT
jgi:ribosomal protein S18 acetylase RimI-like enzyme